MKNPWKKCEKIIALKPSQNTVLWQPHFFHGFFHRFFHRFLTVFSPFFHRFFTDVFTAFSRHRFCRVNHFFKKVFTTVFTAVFTADSPLHPHPLGPRARLGQGQCGQGSRAHRGWDPGPVGPGQGPGPWHWAHGRPQGGRAGPGPGPGPVGPDSTADGPDFSDVDFHTTSLTDSFT